MTKLLGRLKVFKYDNIIEKEKNAIVPIKPIASSTAVSANAKRLSCTSLIVQSYAGTADTEQNKEHRNRRTVHGYGHFHWFGYNGLLRSHPISYANTVPTYFLFFLNRQKLTKHTFLSRVHSPKKNALIYQNWITIKIVK